MVLRARNFTLETFHLEECLRTVSSEYFVLLLSKGKMLVVWSARRQFSRQRDGCKDGLVESEIGNKTKTIIKTQETPRGWRWGEPSGPLSNAVPSAPQSRNTHHRLCVCGKLNEMKMKTKPTCKYRRPVSKSQHFRAVTILLLSRGGPYRYGAESTNWLQANGF